ncbi:MAG: polysaccharide deacetylase family protein [Cyclobacteriaceae bacterium]
MRIHLSIALLLAGFLAFGQKQVAITFDDLVMGGGELSYELMRAANMKIIEDCKAFEVPAIGFVNESKLYKDEKNQNRIAILEAWLDQGLVLGNHTFSHPSLYKTPLEEYQADVLKGERVTRQLMKERNMDLRYFRHPFLNTGPDSLTKAGFERFLDSLNYEIAPVSVESSDYVFNKVYLDAYRNNDSTMMESIGMAYVTHTLRMFDFMDSASQIVVGRPISHIYLCHANHLNAAYMPLIYQGLKEKDFTFISIAEALEDEAYELTDRYIGRSGISWVYRWDGENAIKWLRLEPEIDQEILFLYQN